MILRLFSTICFAALLLLAQEPKIQDQPNPFLLSQAEDHATQEVREARSKVYHGGFSIFEPGPPPTTDVTLMPMSELPLDRSDTVVIGEVTHAQPFPTYDGKALYTEFTIRVLEAIKSAAPITSESIVLLRRGGEARLPEGRVVRWIVRGDGGAPAVGRQYLFFLSKRPAADAYLLRKMWIIQEGLIKAVFPDDIGRVSQGQSVYDGSYLAAVVASLKAGVSQ